MERIHDDVMILYYDSYMKIGRLLYNSDSNIDNRGVAVYNYVRLMGIIIAGTNATIPLAPRINQ